MSNWSKLDWFKSIMLDIGIMHSKPKSNRVDMKCIDLGLVQVKLA